jgi:hypothetical protein
MDTMNAHAPSEDGMALLAASGFDLGWLRQMAGKHGETVLGLIESMLNQGFSAAWIVEAVSKVHPLVMDLFALAFSAPAAARAAADKMGAAALEAGSLGAIVDGIPSGLINGPVVSAILDRAGELLPALGLSGWQLWLAQMALRLIRSGIQAAPAK